MVQRRKRQVTLRVLERSMGEVDSSLADIRDALLAESNITNDANAEALATAIAILLVDLRRKHEQAMVGKLSADESRMFAGQAKQLAALIKQIGGDAKEKPSLFAARPAMLPPKKVAS